MINKPLCSNSGSANFHVSWLSDFIFYPKPLYKSLHQSIFYSFITILPSDLAILTEWWQQRIAWWELFNAARQIICIRKQHTNHMEDDIKRIMQDKQFHLQLKSEHFGQGKIIYANHLPWYIAVIVVFSKSRDKCLKVKVKWRNERVYGKIV